MDDLGENARGLLEAFRAAERPSDARRDAIWNELEASGATGRPRRKIPPMPRERSSGPAPVVTPRRWIPLAALAVAAAVVLVASRWVLVERPGARAQDQRPAEAVHQLDAPRLEGVAGPSEQTPSPSTSPAPIDDVETQIETPSVDPVVPIVRPSTSTKLPKPHEGGELAIIEQAQRALRDDQHARALELLERHRRAHPEGALAEEREFLRAQALCATGRLTEARALATEFVATRPSSSYAGKMRRVCVQRPQTP